MSGHLRDNTNMEENTHQAHIHSFIPTRRIWNEDYGDQMIFGDLLGLVSWHLSYGWGKTSKKHHLGNLSRPGIELRSAAWQARMLPPVSQRWTNFNMQISKCSMRMSWNLYGKMLNVLLENLMRIEHFWNLPIKISLNIHISENNRPTKYKLSTFSIFEI